MKNIFLNRWAQLFFCVLVFVIISGPQYLWPLFVRPFLAKFQTPLSELQIVFSVVVIGMTFITPWAGILNDKFKSRQIIGLGLLLATGSWILASLSTSVFHLIITYGVLGGLGAGIAFIGCTGLVQKSFPKHRGFATGILMSGYALGPLLTTNLSSRWIESKGIEGTLFDLGLALLLLSVVLVFCLREPNQILVKDRITSQDNLIGSTPKVMLKTPFFWLMFVMMCTIATCGMMVTSNISIIAKDFQIGSEVIFLGMAALPLALMFDRVTNGLSRILFGLLSDKIGRENALGTAFFLEAVFIYFWFTQLHNPIYFILVSGLVFLAWGEIFSIFPALCTDTFGEKHASVNFGFLYTSVGVGAMLGGPVAAYIRESTGNWNLVFYLIFGLDVVTAILAFTILKKMRGAHIAHLKETI